MSDYVTITTNLLDGKGAGRDGTLYALMTTKLRLAGGGEVAPCRLPFTVTDGVAADFQLAITEDANPEDASWWLSFQDSTTGHKEDLGALVTPRTDAAIELTDYLTVGEV